VSDQGPDQPPQAIPIGDLVQAFERFDAIHRRPADPEEAAHRRDLERLAARLAGFAVVVVLSVSGWIALDRENRYSDTMQQTAGGALLSLTSGLVGFAVKR
jgi:hypothetical protein